MVRDYPVDGFGRIPRGFGEGRGTILVRNWVLRCRLSRAAISHSGNLAQLKFRQSLMEGNVIRRLGGLEDQILIVTWSYSRSE